MGKEDLIVDNPLLLTSLFGKGVFALTTEMENKEITEESESDNVDSTIESSEEKEPITDPRFAGRHEQREYASGEGQV